MIPEKLKKRVDFSMRLASLIQWTTAGVSVVTSATPASFCIITLTCHGPLTLSTIYFSVSLITISTRRFVCLPSGVSLVATGLILPKPRTPAILSAGRAAPIR